MKDDFQQYKVIKSICNADGISYETYGITNGNVTIQDISTDKVTAEEMVNRMNIGKLEECHLKFFVEDELDK